MNTILGALPLFTDLKGIFPADVIRWLDSCHSKTEKWDAAQDAFLLLIFMKENGRGKELDNSPLS